ncbi:hypothetical protein [Klebsiella phage KA]|uniref:Uncharacterized protein n=1 Tax=Klebsiella phage KA TaxID=3109000 RepID=A0ABZ0ZXB1_9CAUD|nr:hypothetical protein [Klebsiella phage KA]
MVVHERAIHDDIGTCMAYSRDRRWLYHPWASLTLNAPNCPQSGCLASI